MDFWRKLECIKQFGTLGRCLIIVCVWGNGTNDGPAGGARIFEELERRDSCEEREKLGASGGRFDGGG